jgi:ubiquinone/menaquinone biosynthesis C-methylase UbiE
LISKIIKNHSWEASKRVEIIGKVLGGITGGRVLDIATQEGGFVQVLKEQLKDYTEMVGIDINERAIQRARDTLSQDNIRFLVMDAERLDFGNESFDTVSISASLHHLSNIRQVLDEMKRVLKTGGHFLIAEMVRDGQTEAELTSVYLHQWAAEVDTAIGILHNSTLARRELENYVTGLGLTDVEIYDCIDRDSDPMEKTRIEQLRGLIERVLQRAQRAGTSRDLKDRGEQLLNRLQGVGARREPILFVVGMKETEQGGSSGT